MEAVFKRVVFNDEWIEVYDNLKLGPAFEWRNYALGWRFEATQREMDLIESNKMWGHAAITLRAQESYFSFAEVLSPEFIPELHIEQEALLKIQGLVLSAAAKWTLIFETMDDPGC